MLDVNVLFEYFIKEDRNISSDDLFERYPSLDPSDIFPALKVLVQKNLIEEHPTEDIYYLSDYGREYYRDAVEKQKREEAKSAKEIEKLHLEIDDLVSRLTDYDKVKNQAKWAIIFAAVSAIAALIALLK